MGNCIDKNLDQVIDDFWGPDLPDPSPNEKIGYLRSLLAGIANKIEAGKTENLVAEIREYLRTTNNAA